MNYFTRQSVERFFEQLPGWMFLLSGLTLLGFAIITPAWQECRELEQQRELLKLQAQRISEQSLAYAQFEKALATDDPVLLERLAFFHLRLKPAGATPLIGPAGIEPPARTRPLLVNNLARTNSQTSDRKTAVSAEVIQKISQSLISVESWLQRPMPRAGVDFLPPQPINSRLVKWSTEPKSRTMMIGIGALLVLLGMIPLGRMLNATPVRATMLEKM